MASAGVASGRVSSMLVVLAVFAVFPVQQSRAESWREFLLEDEACVQDTHGRFAECDFEGYSNEELQSLLKEIVESNDSSSQECAQGAAAAAPGPSPPGDVSSLKPNVRRQPQQKQALGSTDEAIPEIVDGMDVFIPQRGVRLVFNTPILMAELGESIAPRMGRSIVEYLHKLEKQSKGGNKRKSAMGDGFRTGDDFLQTQVPFIMELEQHLLRLAQHAWQFGRSKPFSGARLALRGWANIMRTGAHHTLHVHPRAVWSGVYYAKVPSGIGDQQRKLTDPSQGCLVVVDPRPGVKMTSINNADAQFVEKMEICPHEGMIIMFPSWLSHYVPYLEVPGERVAVSFNVHAVPL